MRVFRILLIAASCLFLCVFCSPEKVEQSEDSLRPPAVPLITIDPYTSCWVFGDQLAQQATYHWTEDPYQLNGFIRVDGKTYRFMGAPKYNSFYPLSSDKDYTLRYTTINEVTHWNAIDFDDSKWSEGLAPLGWDTTELNIKSQVEGAPVYVRREFEWNENDTRNLAIRVTHARQTARHMTFYINGVKAASLAQARKTRNHPITDEAKQALRPGKNVLAVKWEKRGRQKCFIDFGLVKEKPEDIAVQKSVNVKATQTFFEFECGGVDLSLTFTAPLLMDDLDLLSRPANYITYKVKSNDNKIHQVELYFDASAEWCVNTTDQEVEWKKTKLDGMDVLKIGTTEQAILKKSGDNVRIDWGYFYLAANSDDKKASSIYSMKSQHRIFNLKGEIFHTDTSLARKANDNMPGLAFNHVLDSVNSNEITDYLILAYDDIFSIEYFGDHLPAWWKRDGKTFNEVLIKANKNYKKILAKCNAFDEQLFNDALASGGKKYAELCEISYRQAISAHKLVADKQGTPLFFSKENYSNGSIGTVDVTYPSAPLFLIYNPTLLKGMLEPIFYYSESGKWTKPIAAHDVGKYPIANGQRYGEDMPVEECGNMIIMTAAICHIENDYSYAKQHWEVLTTWANYLKEKGFDPDNQLCTDDFAGHLAHNANLSIKAIEALGCYGLMASELGLRKESNMALIQAEEMVLKWIHAAQDSARFSLTFDKKGTWSQKYNLVWDKMLNLNLFPNEVAETEMAWYKTVTNEYGLPLDSRADYTKSDWILWTACLTDNKEDFDFLVDGVYKFANESADRLPLSDWHETSTGNVVGFRARSVVGGYYMKMLKDILMNE